MISMEFDIVRYVSISLKYFGHKSGTTYLDNEHGEF